MRSYVEANREGRQWLLRYCADNSVAVQRESAFTYTTSTGGTVSLREELDAARAAGLDAHWTDVVDLPFPVVGALRLDDQAQFDAVQALDALVQDFVQCGGTVHEGTRVRTVHGNRHRRSVHTNRGVVTAARVVIATGTPILDRGAFFARLEPQRSYAAAFTVPGDIPRGMYISVDKPERSIRYAPRNDSNLLLVGGNGHPVGRAASPSQCLQELIDWTGKTFPPGAELTHSWSAQDYRPVNELPYVGELLPGDPLDPHCHWLREMGGDHQLGRCRADTGCECPRHPSTVVSNLYPHGIGIKCPECPMLFGSMLEWPFT